MRLVWVPQWTVLPVILEDNRMVDDNESRSGPAGGQSLDPSGNQRMADGGLRSGSRMYNPSFCLVGRRVNCNGGARQLTRP